MMIKLNVIGDPIEHSMSPKVHKLCLDEIGVEFKYEKVRVEKGGLKEYIASAVCGGVTGFNLTMPHKQDIIPFLDYIDDEARTYNSVNTVRIKDGKLLGYNTDAVGYVLSLGSLGFSFEGKNIVILGAGGVANTLAVKAALLGAEKISVLNRTVQKAAKTCELAGNIFESKFGEENKPKLFYDGSAPRTVEMYVSDCDLLINATPLGMHGVERDYEDLEFMERLPKNAIASDLIYNPPKTSFLRAAENAGLKIINGMGMLLGQAIAADKIFTELDFSPSEIYEKLSKR